MEEFAAGSPSRTRASERSAPNPAGERRRQESISLAVQKWYEELLVKQPLLSRSPIPIFALSCTHVSGAAPVMPETSCSTATKYPGRANNSSFHPRRIVHAAAMKIVFLWLLAPWTAKVQLYAGDPV
ncbi:MAG: hypothetical protein WCK77_02710 [Verrucomicrobiota bacterium]